MREVVSQGEEGPLWVVRRVEEVEVRPPSGVVCEVEIERGATHRSEVPGGDAGKGTTQLSEVPGGDAGKGTTQLSEAPGGAAGEGKTPRSVAPGTATGE